MNLLKRVLGSLEARLSQPWLNPWRTVYFNFRTLPFPIAVKFPIYIYGKVRFFGLNGNVRIECENVHRGMIKIGVNGDSFSLPDHSGYVQIASSKALIVFEGPCRIALNTKIRTIVGELRFGAFSRVGSGSKVVCNGGKIYIGANTGITFGCTIMNSSFHYTYDSVNHCYNNRTKNISIGNRVWVGNQTTILGGAILPDDTIVGTGSLINASYADYTGKYAMLAGRPGKVVRQGIKRVFSPEAERRVSSLFVNPELGWVNSDEFPDNPDDVIEEM